MYFFSSSSVYLIRIFFIFCNNMSLDPKSKMNAQKLCQESSLIDKSLQKCSQLEQEVNYMINYWLRDGGPLYVSPSFDFPNWYLTLKDLVFCFYL